jgi:serine protease Do
MTAAFAASLGMVEPYGAIFEQPEPNSPAAEAKIMEGDVVAAVNGVALMNSSDFAPRISEMAPGSLVNLTTYRNGQLMQTRLTLGAAKCPANNTARAPA